MPIRDNRPSSMVSGRLLSTHLSQFNPDQQVVNTTYTTDLKQESQALISDIQPINNDEVNTNLETKTVNSEVIKDEMEVEESVLNQSENKNLINKNKSTINVPVSISVPNVNTNTNTIINNLNSVKSNINNPQLRIMTPQNFNNGNVNKLPFAGNVPTNTVSQTNNPFPIFNANTNQINNQSNYHTLKTNFNMPNIQGMNTMGIINPVNPNINIIQGFNQRNNMVNMGGMNINPNITNLNNLNNLNNLQGMNKINAMGNFTNINNMINKNTMIPVANSNNINLNPNNLQNMMNIMNNNPQMMNTNTNFMLNNITSSSTGNISNFNNQTYTNNNLNSNINNVDIQDLNKQPINTENNQPDKHHLAELIFSMVKKNSTQGLSVDINKQNQSGITGSAVDPRDPRVRKKK